MPDSLRLEITFPQSNHPDWNLYLWADAHDYVQFKAILKDGNGNPIAGKELTFDPETPKGTLKFPQGKTTNANGEVAGKLTAPTLPPGTEEGSDALLGHYGNIYSNWLVIRYIRKLTDFHIQVTPTAYRGAETENDKWTRYAKIPGVIIRGKEQGTVQVRVSPALLGKTVTFEAHEWHPDKAIWESKPSAGSYSALTGTLEFGSTQNNYVRCSITATGGNESNVDGIRARIFNQFTDQNGYTRQDERIRLMFADVESSTHFNVYFVSNGYDTVDPLTRPSYSDSPPPPQVDAQQYAKDFAWALEAAYATYRGGGQMVDFGASGHDLLFKDNGRMPMVVQMTEQDRPQTFPYDVVTQQVPGGAKKTGALSKHLLRPGDVGTVGYWMEELGSAALRDRVLASVDSESGILPMHQVMGTDIGSQCATKLGR